MSGHEIVSKTPNSMQTHTLFFNIQIRWNFKASTYFTFIIVHGMYYVQGLFPSYRRLCAKSLANSNNSSLVAPLNAPTKCFCLSKPHRKISKSWTEGASKALAPLCSAQLFVPREKVPGYVQVVWKYVQYYSYSYILDCIEAQIHQESF